MTNKVLPISTPTAAIRASGLPRVDFSDGYFVQADMPFHELLSRSLRQQAINRSQYA